jgi:hypothetical protein
VLKTRTAHEAVLALVDAHIAWVVGNPVEARFMYRALALDIEGIDREALVRTKLRLKAGITAHLTQLGVLSGREGTEAMLDIVLLGVTHQACRSWLAAPSSVSVKWMKRELGELAWRTVKVVRE